VLILRSLPSRLHASRMYLKQGKLVLLDMGARVCPSATSTHSHKLPSAAHVHTTSRISTPEYFNMDSLPRQPARVLCHPSTLRSGSRCGQAHGVAAGRAGHAGHAHGKHAAPVRRGVRPRLHARGHVQRGQAGPAERARGRAARGQLDVVQARAGARVVARDRARLAQRHPQVARAARGSRGLWPGTRPARKAPGCRTTRSSGWKERRSATHAPAFTNDSAARPSEAARRRARMLGRHSAARGAPRALPHLSMVMPSGTPSAAGTAATRRPGAAASGTPPASASYAVTVCAPLSTKYMNGPPPPASMSQAMPLGRPRLACGSTSSSAPGGASLRRARAEAPGLQGLGGPAAWLAGRCRLPLAAAAQAKPPGTRRARVGASGGVPYIAAGARPGVSHALFGQDTASQLAGPRCRPLPSPGSARPLASSSHGRGSARCPQSR
jgi:hypothetical protein